jgi:lipopolysaccharide export system ATP-binding protein
MSPIFSADSIAKRYGSEAVLKGASIGATPGRITALFGRNGCGKSTLLRIGAGLLAADQGTVRFEGRVYTRPRLHRLAAQGLFFLPDRDLLSPRFTLREHLRAVAWRFGGAGIPAVIDRLGLASLLDQRTDSLSGGERRRASLAVAWARAPRCLLADEPFAGISPRDGETVAAVFRELARGGCALVVTGHEVPQLMEIADEVVWMVAGTTHDLGAPAEALVNEQFRRGYLGPGAATPTHPTALRKR